MTILDDKEASNSLRVIVLMVSLLTFAAFAGLFMINGAQSTAHQQTSSQESKPL